MIRIQKKKERNQKKQKFARLDITYWYKKKK